MIVIDNLVHWSIISIISHDYQYQYQYDHSNFTIIPLFSLIKKWDIIISLDILWFSLVISQNYHTYIYISLSLVIISYDPLFYDHGDYELSLVIITH
jgi:hypothetical protein